MKRTLLFFLACALACVGAADLARSARLEPFAETCLISCALAASSFAFGLGTGDYSWVDRLWSLVPILYAWLYALKEGAGSAPMVAALLVSLWGARLTFNFARRGGYSGTEDYRWSALRSRIPSPLLWQAFNAAFICAFQLGLVTLFVSPLGMLVSGAEIGPLAIAVPGLLCLGFIAFETEADREQWEFQSRKAERLALPAADRPPDEEAERGFRSSGLFRLSRHPAYFGEIGFWWSFYLVCALGSGRILDWRASGAALLTGLFALSVGFTESLSASKYPAYRDYQERSSAVLPWFPRGK
jgi:steroid 5-alpha reductase family enzyme